MALDSEFFRQIECLCSPGMGTEKMAPLLYSLICFNRPRSLLEIGAGYTTPFMAQALLDTVRDWQQEQQQSGNSNFVEGYHARDYSPSLLCIDNQTHSRSTAAKVQALVSEIGLDGFDESSGAGTGFLADVCRQWERAAESAAKAAVRVVSLRTGIVMSRDGGALPTMAFPFRIGLGGRMGSGQQWVSWIHIDDVVALIRKILLDVDFRGPVNAVAPTPVRNCELTSALAQKLRRPARLPAPAFALRAVLGELSGELLGSRRCIPKLALDRGFEFSHTRIETAFDTELA